MATAVATDTKAGKVVQVIGPVIDVEFEAGHLPEIYNALRVVSEGKGADQIDVVAEVEQHLGENRVRAVAMKPPDETPETEIRPASMFTPRRSRISPRRSSASAIEA